MDNAKLTSRSHASCIKCVQIQCQRQDHCQMIDCDNVGCGAHLHFCKLTEHKLLCLHQIVQCVNWYYGCPLTMPRHKIGQHLRVCPASIVHCNRTWSRCPTWCDTADRNPPYISGQIDYESAICDQQRLLSFYDNCTNRDFESIVKRRFSSSHTCWFNDYTEGDKFNDDMVKFIAQSQLCTDIVHQIQMLNINHNENAVKTNQQFIKEEDMHSLLDHIEILQAIQQRSRLLIRSHQDLQASNSYERSRKLQLKDGRWIDNIDTLSTANQYQDKNKTFTEIEQIVQAEQLQLNQLLLQLTHQLKKLSTKSVILRSKDLIHLQNLLDVLESSDNIINLKYTNERKLGAPRYSNLTVIRMEYIKNAYKMLKYMQNRGIVLGLHLQPGLHDQEHVFQICCDRYFRRDEYAQHIKFSHTEMQCELTGWFSRRCPLAQYGCPFQCNVIKPSAGEISLDSHLAAFILSNCDKRSTDCRGYDASDDTKNSTRTEQKCCQLFDLPNEVIERILLFLDSYSLYNLSLTCNQMREACLLMLTKKGTVALQWKKVNGKWLISRKVWSYSTACSSTNDWRIGDTSAISKHLQMCPYSIKQDYPEKPILLPIFNPSSMKIP